MELCDSYLPEKKFPDKAFDILDEAGAKTKSTTKIKVKLLKFEYYIRNICRKTKHNSRKCKK